MNNLTHLLQKSLKIITNQVTLHLWKPLHFTCWAVNCAVSLTVRLFDSYREEAIKLFPIQLTALSTRIVWNTKSYKLLENNTPKWLWLLTIVSVLGLAMTMITPYNRNNLSTSKPSTWTIKIKWKRFTVISLECPIYFLFAIIFQLFYR